MDSEIKLVLNNIIDQIVEKGNIIFVDKALNTIIQIISSANTYENNEKLKSYEYYRYTTIAMLLCDFIIKLKKNIIDIPSRERLQGYLDYAYKQSKYIVIFKNLKNLCNQKNIKMNEYTSEKIILFRELFYKIIDKQFNILRMMQNKMILEKLSKSSIDDLFNKLIFELTFYVTFLI